jgi:predicted nucleic acid-binding protein
MEGVIQEAVQMLKCKMEDLVSSMKKAIDKGGKEKLAALEKQRSLDHIVQPQRCARCVG